MNKYLRYLWALLRHKWFVGVECFREGLFWRGIIHDWSKFLPDEFIPYANFFYGDKKVWKDRFNLAWNKHQKRHDHHWQFWMLVEDYPEDVWSVSTDGVKIYHERLPDIELHPAFTMSPDSFTSLTNHLLRASLVIAMSDKARREMLCDWKGANRAYNAKQTLNEWYLQRQHLMQARLHPDTLVWIEKSLGV